MRQKIFFFTLDLSNISIRCFLSLRQELTQGSHLQIVTITIFSQKLNYYVLKLKKKRSLFPVLTANH